MNPLTRTTRPDASVLQKLYAPVADDLRIVESILHREMSNEHPAVDELVRYGCLLGGKRLRPALLLLVARACGAIDDRHRVLAAVVEMIHTATLVHDDVLDEAETRRHLATVNARWDNRSSILLGDYLFSHAFFLAAGTGSTFACRRIGRATNIVCEGEMRQKATCGDYGVTEAQYLEIISAKTAELCACSCELGASFNDVDPSLATRMSDYGRHLGIAFQIVDDILDLQGDEQATGKSLGTDLDQRIPTLPLVWLLGQVSEGERESLVAVLSESTDEARRRLGQWFERYGAIEYAVHRARDYAELARRDADCLPPGPASEVLRSLPDFVVERSA